MRESTHSGTRQTGCLAGHMILVELPYIEAGMIEPGSGIIRSSVDAAVDRPTELCHRRRRYSWELILTAGVVLILVPSFQLANSSILPGQRQFVTASSTHSLETNSALTNSSPASSSTGNTTPVSGNASQSSNVSSNLSTFVTNTSASIPAGWEGVPGEPYLVRNGTN